MGQAALVAFIASGAVKRLAYLGLRVRGLDVVSADLASDKIAIVGAQAALTLAASASLDPIGLVGGAAHIGLLEAELRCKEQEIAEHRQRAVAAQKSITTGHMP